MSATFHTVDLSQWLNSSDSNDLDKIAEKWHDAFQSNSNHLNNSLNECQQTLLNYELAWSYCLITLDLVIQPEFLNIK